VPASFLGTKITFERVIVWPDGRREIEGVTPKALPAPENIDVIEPPELSE
jgi:hypothetical protein